MWQNTEDSFIRLSRGSFLFHPFSEALFFLIRLTREKFFRPRVVSIAMLWPLTMPEEYRKIVQRTTGISIIRRPTFLERDTLGKLAKSVCSFFFARKWCGRLCRRFYYRNGRRSVLRSTRSCLYKGSFAFMAEFRSASPERILETSPTRTTHKRRSPENWGLRANLLAVSISLWD